MLIFQSKQKLVDPVDLHGVLRVRLGVSGHTWISTYLTRLDQALVIWGVVTAVIFLIAQFHYLLDWSTQAALWSGLTIAATVLSGRLTWFWVTTRDQRWILYVWSCLVLIGLGLTNYGIFGLNGWILSHLCSLWLGLSAVGYFATGVGIKAQALILMGLVHLGGISLLAILPRWQFLLTGLLMSFSLWCLAAFHWDHQ